MSEEIKQTDHQEQENVSVKQTDHQEQENASAKRETTAFQIMVKGILVMLAVATLCSVSFSLLMARSGNKESEKREVYDHHYVLIADDAEDEFWDKVYAGAQKEAEKEHVYVEKMGDILAVDYSTEGLMRMAINSSVDGIILYAEDTKEMTELINQAVEKGIFVVTMRQDIDSSNRQCFVGVSSYDLGQEYGKQILEILQTETEATNISILVDESTNESRQTMLTMGIKDVLSEILEEDMMPDIRMQRIDTSDTFSAEEAIRDIFMNETDLPDILVCLNSIYTQCAYQAVVDYNHVGDVKIIGYYASNTILEAIEKQIVYSTIRVEPEEIGKSSVTVLNDYQQTGYANSYVPVSMKVIDQKEAVQLLNEVSDDENAGN
ncbi:MAG: substrate-binding domain-containing protein [Lachnospiraceae bacterium]